MPIITEMIPWQWKTGEQSMTSFAKNNAKPLKKRKRKAVMRKTIVIPGSPPTVHIRHELSTFSDEIRHQSNSQSTKVSGSSIFTFRKGPGKNNWSRVWTRAYNFAWIRDCTSAVRRMGPNPAQWQGQQVYRPNLTHYSQHDSHWQRREIRQWQSLLIWEFWNSLAQVQEVGKVKREAKDDVVGEGMRDEEERSKVI